MADKRTYKIDGDLVWSDEKLETKFWENPRFQEIYQPCRSDAIELFRNMRAIAWNQGKVAYHSSELRWMSLFPGICALLENRELSVETREKILRNTYEAMPFAVQDVQGYICSGAEFLVKEFEMPREIFKQLPDAQIKLVLETAFNAGSLAIQTSLPHAVYSAISSRSLERTITRKNSQDSFIPNFKNLIEDRLR